MWEAESRSLDSGRIRDDILMVDDSLDPGFERILRRVVPLLGDGHLRPETDLLAAGLDSMGAVQLLSEIEHAYEVIIPDEALLGDVFATPSALWQLVSEHRTSA